MRTDSMSRAVAALFLAATALSFEPVARFQASKILPPAIRQGPHHRVSDDVRAEHFYQQFHLASDFGDMDVEGRALLRTRVGEIDAIARLSEASKGKVFAQAAGGAVLNVGKGVVGVVTQPVATAKGIGGGLKRFGVNLGRKARRAVDSATKDDMKPDDPDQTKKEKALDVAGGVANSVVGVNGAARRWAQKLGVDPYTSNPILHKALVDVGKIDAAGSIATRVALPVPVVVSATATVGGLVWGADPEELRKTNEARLAELGVSKEAAAQYLINGNYTLTSQTRLIAALHAVGVKGCADYVEAASEASNEREALFFVESAEMLVGLHRRGAVAGVLPDSRAMVAKVGTRAVLLMPFDWVRWTEPLQSAAVEIAARARQELGAKTLEVRVSGATSPSARAGLREAGWSVTDGVIAGLAVSPGD
jgi:hypothetical protein